KIVGGGFPIGVICGRKEIMELSNTANLDKTERSYIGGGTFSANPATMSAGFATLSTLKKSKNTIYPKINNFGKTTRQRLTKIFDGRVKVTGKGSLFMTHFLKNGVSEINDAADAARCDSALLHKYHFEMMVKDGIFFLPGKLGAISNAHSQKDLDSMFKASERFSESL
ncbi:aspartate aminotransferase family protein, partial [Nitrosopumilus sp. b1]|uniref:aminotransferase class III-fold pyridoxal phosphate-dependent enzyme n=1 Tax=Nitrosopumilus sp. b1 TaxID=2109907 RepID=UPI0015F6812D